MSPYGITRPQWVLKNDAKYKYILMVYENSLQDTTSYQLFIIKDISYLVSFMWI